MLLTFTPIQEVLREWEEELEARPEAEKRTAHGKYAKATWHQTRQYLKPLFKQLKRKSCPADIVEYMDRIVAFCRDREYVKANDSYLQMSIGNAPWPMGVSSCACVPPCPHALVHVLLIVTVSFFYSALCSFPLFCLLCSCIHSPTTLRLAPC